MSKTQKLIKNSFWIIIQKASTLIISFITGIIVIRKLSVEDFGYFSILLATFNVFLMLSLSGVNQVINRYIPEFDEKNDIWGARKLLKICIVIALSIFIIIQLSFFIFNEQIANFFNFKNFNVIYIYFIIYSISAFLYYILDIISKALLLHYKSALAIIITNLLRLIIYIIFIDKLNVQVLLVIEASVLMVFIIYISYIIIKYLPKTNIPTHPNNTYWNAKKSVMLKYGAFASLNELGAGIISKYSDSFIISSMGNQISLGIYSFGAKIYNLLYSIIPIKEFYTLVRPIFFQKFSSEDYDINEFNNMYNYIIKILLLIYLFPLIYFLIFGKELIFYVLDPKYIIAYNIANIILSSYLIIPFFYPLGLTIMLKERMDLIFYTKIVAIFSIVFGILAMKYIGIYGVATVTVLGELFKNLLMYFLSKRIIRIKYYFKDYFKFFLINIIFGIVFYFINLLSNGIITFIIFSFLFFVSYVFINIKFNIFNDYDKELINRILSTNKKTAFILKYIHL